MHRSVYCRWCVIVVYCRFWYAIWINSVGGSEAPQSVFLRVLRHNEWRTKTHFELKSYSYRTIDNPTEVFCGILWLQPSCGWAKNFWFENAWKLVELSIPSTTSHATMRLPSQRVSVYWFITYFPPSSIFSLPVHCFHLLQLNEIVFHTKKGRENAVRLTLMEKDVQGNHSDLCFFSAFRLQYFNRLTKWASFRWPHVTRRKQCSAHAVPLSVP